jgi:DNA-binding YbaB/EbfC family protein
MPDFLGLMKQATELKSKMEAMQAELDRLEVEGSSGGGMVAVKLSGKGDLRGVRIDDSLLKPDQKEILEDLLVAAHADARRRLEAMLQEKMQALTGGLRADCFGVMPGLGPGIPTHMARLCRINRDCRDQPGNDE